MIERNPQAIMKAGSRRRFNTLPDGHLLTMRLVFGLGLVLVLAMPLQAGNISRNFNPKPSENPGSCPPAEPCEVPDGAPCEERNSLYSFYRNLPVQRLTAISIPPSIGPTVAVTLRHDPMWDWEDNIKREFSFDYLVSVHYTNANPNVGGWKMWIDWNRDGTFDENADEIVANVDLDPTTPDLAYPSDSWDMLKDTNADREYKVHCSQSCATKKTVSITAQLDDIPASVSSDENLRLRLPLEALVLLLQR